MKGGIRQREALGGKRKNVAIEGNFSEGKESTGTGRVKRKLPQEVFDRRGFALSRRCVAGP